MPARPARPLAARLLTIVAVTATATLAAPSRADAHAIVSETRPAVDEVVARAPDAVVMRFNEPVELAFGAIRVFDTDGHRVDRGDAHHVGGQADAIGVDLDEGLADGTYTVTWRVVSADGHPVHEAFVFHVGAPGERPEGIATTLLAGETGAGAFEGFLAGVARALLFASLLALGGAFAFLVLWERSRAGARPVEVEQAFARRSRRVAAGAWLGAVAGTAGAYVMQGAIAGDLALGDAVSPDVLREVAETRFGRVSVARVVLLGAVALVAWSVGRRRARSATPARPVIVLAGALLVGLLATPGLAGHAGTTSPVAVNVVLDTVHVGAGAAWIGGLLVLVVAAFPSSRSLGDAERRSLLTPVVTRFSDLALGAVGLLVGTGVARGWVEVRTFDALSESYGVVLLVKVGAFLPIVALGAYNNRWLKPRLEAAGTEAGRGLRVLRRTVVAEVALGVAVVVVTSLLVNLPPARVAAGGEGPFITDVRLGEYRLNVLVDPNAVGENEVHLTARTERGAPAPVQEMEVLFRMPDEDIGPLVGRGLELAPGHFVVQGRQLSLGGRWVLEIVARTGRFDEDRARITVRVN